MNHGVGYHHIHHLNPLVPGTRLKEAHEANIHLFEDVPIVHLGDNLQYSLFNEREGTFVSVADKTMEWLANGGSINRDE